MTKVKLLRISNNVRSIDMAKLLNISKATYSKKENGLVKFSLNEAKIIADYFGTNIEDIFFDNLNND